jgi:cardiolipin synthase A/B
MVERAKAGVKVHVIVDGLGSSKLKGKDARRMMDAGVEFERYNPPLFLRFFWFNHRSHRKLTVVDGRIGFIGGVCIADEWMGDAEPGQWRDTHFRVEGPAVGQLQTAFVDNWVQERGMVLHGEGYFPKIEPKGRMLAQAFKSGPREGAESARLAYLLSFAAAKKSIRISHAYFVPDGLVLQSLVDAARRGVKVQIIFPAKIDNIAVKKAGWTKLRRLLEAGAEFYEYQPTLYHCKVVIVDDVWAIVGSVNFDDRSLRLNDEANLNVLDEEFAAKLIRTFEDDKAKSTPLTLEKFKKRKLITRLLDHFAGLFKTQL